MSLTREQILAADDLQPVAVEVPEWSLNGQPGVVWLRVMTGAERDDFEHLVSQRMRGGKLSDYRGIKAALLVATAVDERGQRLFADDDIPALEQKSAGAINRLVDAAQAINGLTQRDVEELRGN